MCIKCLNISLWMISCQTPLQICNLLDLYFPFIMGTCLKRKKNVNSVSVRLLTSLLIGQYWKQSRCTVPAFKMHPIHRPINTIKLIHTNPKWYKRGTCGLYLSTIYTVLPFGFIMIFWRREGKDLNQSTC